MTNKTLIFFIDAVRKDYITEKHSPFLYKYMNNETYMDAVSLLGYSSGIHPTIFTGKYQENHELFLVYSRSDGNGPFTWMKYLKYLPTKITQYFLAALKAPYYLIKGGRKYYPRWYINSILPIPASITPEMAPFFKIESYDFSNDFFKVLNKDGISNSSQPDFDNPNYGKGVGLKNWKLTDNPIDYYFSYEIDPVGHSSGPCSDDVYEKMEEIDSKISKLVNEAEQNGEKPNIFIFSDHGMVDIVNNVNIKDSLENSELKKVDDYIAFYDSTMARFWVEDEKVKNRIIEIISKIDHVTYLDEELKNKYKINFPTRKWGDLLFIVDPGYRVFPDYFAPVRFNTKGMHGYWPEDQKGKGIFMTNTFKTEKKEINVVDFMPTMLDAIGKNNLIPNDIDGKSII